ncbi:MAG: UDP-glucose 4-epimerase GalE [Parachlamydia sp.]|nr:UDP-glucose 4-epimerase GalE [Parachlamydia sp.]
MNTILVAGGAGYIGSQINKMLQQAGYQTVVIDNLSRGSRSNVVRGEFAEGDIGDSAFLDRLFAQYSFSAVMHFAALIDVGESIQKPDLYYVNNVSRTLTLLQTMLRHGVTTFIFSSTAAVYGLPLKPTIDEAHPCNPINPYGESKLIVEKMLSDLGQAYGLKFCALRYFNAAGGDPEGEIKNRRAKDSNLIPLALRSLLEPAGKVKIFGTDYPTRDGTCVRDYIHVSDLGRAHITALENLLSGSPSCCYNLGNGEGFTVREVLQTIEKVTGRRLNIEESARRPGDPPVLVANAALAQKALNWRPRYPNLDSMIEHAWLALDYC